MKACALIIALALFGPPAAAKTPELFFYPPGYRLPNGAFVPTTLTNDVAEVTTAFPRIPVMRGVVISIYWSRLCPKEDACDFPLIDQILRYWKQRNKRIILSIPTVGFPMQISSDVKGGFVTATPPWVLDRVLCYEHATTTTIGTGLVPTPTTFRYPSFIDPAFQKAVETLIHMLGRYDDDPTISQIRISTGFQGEDNASLDALKWTEPDMNDLEWVRYCRKMFELYHRVFHRTQIEFDLGRVSWIALTGEAGAAAEADRLVHDMITENTFLAFNGLTPATRALLHQRPPVIGPGKSLEYLRLAKANDKGIGLEAAQPLYTKLMRNIPDIAAAVTELGLDRLVLFGDAAEALQNGSASSATFDRSAPLRDLVRANAAAL